MEGMGRPWRICEMNETVKYMTVEECNLYRELAAKHEGSILKMSKSLPCCQPYSKVEDSQEVKESSKRKLRTKRSVRR